MIKFLKGLFKKDKSPTVTVNIVISDIERFQNMKPHIERELAKISERGLKRKSPRY